MTLKFSTDFFTNFLNENGDTVIQEKWSDEQVKYKKLFKKNENKMNNKENKGPKKNKSAYNIYCSSILSSLKEELPDLDNKTLFSEMAKRWKTVKQSSEYEKYKLLADEDKNRYTEEKNTFLGIDLNNPKPKRPKTSYIFFSEDEKKKISDLKGKKLIIELGSRWRNLKATNDKRLEYYANLAAADKERYANEMQTGIIAPIPVVVDEPEPVVVDEPVVVEEPKKQTKKKKAVKN